MAPEPSMPPPDDRSALRDIQHRVGLILEATANLDRQSFLADWLVIAAVERQMSVIGEAVKRLSPEFRAAHPGIDWRGWAGLRDILVHAYDSVAPYALWDAVQREVRELDLAVAGFQEKLADES